MFRLWLRGHRHKLALLKTNEQRSYQLALHYGDEQNRRAESLGCWDVSREAPRLTQQGITIPLDTREQTILSYEVSPVVRAIINGQGAPMIHSRSEATPGKKSNPENTG
jgi:hypothetical protein